MMVTTWKIFRCMTIVNILGDWSKWVIDNQLINDSTAFIASTNTGLISPPLTGWQYSPGCGEILCEVPDDDDTMIVRGNNISCSGDFYYLVSNIQFNFTIFIILQATELT